MEFPYIFFMDWFKGNLTGNHGLTPTYTIATRNNREKNIDTRKFRTVLSFLILELTEFCLGDSSAIAKNHSRLGTRSDFCPRFPRESWAPVWWNIATRKWSHGIQWLGISGGNGTWESQQNRYNWWAKAIQMYSGWRYSDLFIQFWDVWIWIRAFLVGRSFQTGTSLMILNACALDDKLWKFRMPIGRWIFKTLPIRYAGQKQNLVAPTIPLEGVEQR